MVDLKGIEPYTTTLQKSFASLGTCKPIEIYGMVDAATAFMLPT